MDEAKLWKSHFGRKSFANCYICKNQIRIKPLIAKILLINNFHNLKCPQVFWCENMPICYMCNDLGNSINEIKSNITNRSELEKLWYYRNWYIKNGYCYHGNNKYKLCGSKDLHSEGLCLKHYNNSQSEVSLKKTKFAF